MLQCIILHGTLRISVTDFQILSFAIGSNIQDLNLNQPKPREFLLPVEEKALNGMHTVSIASSLE